MDVLEDVAERGMPLDVMEVLEEVAVWGMPLDIKEILDDVAVWMALSAVVVIELC